MNHFKSKVKIQLDGSLLKSKPSECNHRRMMNNDILQLCQNICLLISTKTKNISALASSQKLMFKGFIRNSVPEVSIPKLCQNICFFKYQLSKKNYSSGLRR